MVTPTDTTHFSVFLDAPTHPGVFLGNPGDLGDSDVPAPQTPSDILRPPATPNASGTP